jgi:hypothetical protein
MGFAINCPLARHHMPQNLLLASFRPRLTTTPLQFAMTSPPSVVHVASRPPQSMKMNPSLAMMDAPLRGVKTVQPWSAIARLISLVWTSFVPQIVASLEGEHAGQIVSHFDVLSHRRREEEERLQPWKTYLRAAPAWMRTRKSVEACYDESSLAGNYISRRSTGVKRGLSPSSCRPCLAPPIKRAASAAAPFIPCPCPCLQLSSFHRSLTFRPALFHHF